MGKFRANSPLGKRLQAHVMQGRRESLYRLHAKRNDGTVHCYVCGRHVKKPHASLEHKVPTSHGGTDDMDNLAISHGPCNQRRGDNLDFECVGAWAWARPVPDELV